MEHRFRVEKVKRQIHDDGGFTTTASVYCVVNECDHVYSVFWGNRGGELAALAYRDKLSPTMRPPALGGHIDNGWYSK